MDEPTIKTDRPHPHRTAEFCNKIPPKADIEQHDWHVRFVSKADITQTQIIVSVAPEAGLRPKSTRSLMRKGSQSGSA